MSVPAFLIDELARHISNHRPGTGPDDLVFTGAQGGPLRRSFEARTFKPALEKACLDPALTFHGLRHVAASLMVEHGEHPRVIQARLGLVAPVNGALRPTSQKQRIGRSPHIWTPAGLSPDRARSGHEPRAALPSRGVEASGPPCQKAWR